ncbi:ISAzo13 family transposase [Nonomuraea sp. NPDC003804]|uniref:ISAzo13 family transposase n=1 Tax=Nonomuraea sp. NPDC003804 TaxID=3154547 RepID=UPI0033B5F54F
MAILPVVLDQLALKFEVVLPHLNERQRRLLLAAEARLLGHGGVRAVARVAGVSESTVRKGVFELEDGGDVLPGGRVRREGGGRKSAEELDPQVLSALLALVEPDERGDPESPLRWTTKSLRHLADELTRQGHRVSPPTVGRLLREAGFSLQGNAKTLEGKQHPDRDAQFRYISEQVKQHQAAGEPVISVDTKKREQLGRLPNPGREWRPKGDPIEVEDHSFFFTGPDVEQAIPYGIYDISANTGWVNVGIDHDTSTFAVASIRRWWQARGRLDYPDASRLLITADAGGSNSYRFRVWKAELAALAAETGLAITVCHFPPGTSKWNKIEHRLFSHITMNWRGRPLTSHEVVVNIIASTRTRTGLRVEAELDTASYPLGVTVSKARFAELPIHAHPTHGSWNYTIHPALVAADRPPVVGTDRAQIHAAALRALADSRLTGMTEAQLDDLARRLAPAQAARAEQRTFHQRGGERRRTKGAGSHSLLSNADRVLITVVYLRQICSQKVLSDLLEVSDFTIGYWIAETRKLLTEHQVTVPATTMRFTTAAQLRSFLDNDDVPAQRPRISETLSHPTLTGMSREELRLMIERLTPLQAARLERLRYQRRGGERLPGARGGIFQQKITDAERILAAILYQRKACTRQALSELFEVSPRTIGNTLIETRPLLEHDGYNPAPAPTRHRTAAALLASISPC